MPAYDFHCECSHSEFSVVRSIAQRNDPLACICGLPMIRQEVYHPLVQADYSGYTSPVTGQWIEGKKAHQEDLKRNGCRVFEPGEREAFVKNKAKREEDYGRRVEAIVEKAASELMG